MSTTPSRMVCLLAAAALSLGGLAVSTAPRADAAPTAPTGTSASWPWMSTSFRHSVSGRTLTFRYADTGYQHRMKAPDGVWANHDSMGHRVIFGDGDETGADGGVGACLTTSRLNGFSTTMPAQKHRYAKRGTYKVKVIGYYCGTGGRQSVTKTYTVRVR